MPTPRSPLLFTVLDLLDFVRRYEARIDIDSPLFECARIGHTKVDANTRLTENEQVELKQLTDQLAGLKDLKAINAHVERIEALANKPEPLRFVADQPEPRGYSVDGLVGHEERANVSFRVRRTGSVDLSSRLPPELTSKVPILFPTFQYRNYTIIRDGVVHIKVLPVVGLPLRALDYLRSVQELGYIPPNSFTEGVEAGTVLFDLTQLPVINEGSVQRISAKRFFAERWATLKLQARIKCLKDEYTKRFDKKPEGFEALYGAAASLFLAKNGIVSYSGFNPEVLQTEPTAVYKAKVLEVKIKGYSALPSVNEVRKRMEEKKPLNGPAKLMEPTIQLVSGQSKLWRPESIFKEWCEREMKILQDDIRRSQRVQAEQVFAIIVGKLWFDDLNPPNEISMEIMLDGEELQFTAKLKEVQEKI